MEVPAWVQPLVSRSGGRLVLLNTTIPQAASLSGPALSDAVAAAYRQLASTLAGVGRYPIRIWNFVPDIQAPLADGDRYMAFNAGRYMAYAEWFGSIERLTSVPTASAVGTTEDSLSIHVLAAEAPGAPVENPRQIPAYRYSRRYGTRPPCFARATKWNGTLLIGGTASIIGEDSIGGDDIEAQTHETFENLAALIRHAGARSSPAALDHIIDLRVHVSEPDHAPRVAALLGEVVPGCATVEFVVAKLCRRELLVEIEGRAAC